MGKPGRKRETNETLENMKRAYEIIQPGYAERRFNIDTAVFHKMLVSCGKEKDDFIVAGTACGLSAEKSIDIYSALIGGGKPIGKVLKDAQTAFQNEFLLPALRKEKGAKAKTLLRAFIGKAGNEAARLCPGITEAKIKSIKEEIRKTYSEGGRPLSEPKETIGYKRALDFFTGEQGSRRPRREELAPFILLEIFLPIDSLWHETPADRIARAMNKHNYSILSKRIERRIERLLLEMLDKITIFVIPCGAISAFIKKIKEEILKAWDHLAEEKPRK